MLPHVESVRELSVADFADISALFVAADQTLMPSQSVASLVILAALRARVQHLAILLVTVERGQKVVALVLMTFQAVHSGVSLSASGADESLIARFWTALSETRIVVLWSRRGIREEEGRFSWEGCPQFGRLVVIPLHVDFEAFVWKICIFFSLLTNEGRI